MIKLVAFIGLEGVNNVFSHVSLILVVTFLFLRAFLGCTGIRFLILFLVPLALRASTLYMRPHVSTYLIYPAIFMIHAAADDANDNANNGADDDANDTDGF